MHAARALVFLAALAAAPACAEVSHPFTSQDGATIAGRPVDCGGTITLGGTAQTAIAANTGRKNAIIENPPGATEDLFVSLTGSATTTGAGDYADLSPGGSLAVLGSAAVSVIAATTAHRFVCTEFQ